MKPAKLRDMTIDELSREEHELSDRLLWLRLQKAMGQQEGVTKIREVRRDLARVKTVLTEKSLSRDREGAGQ